MTYVGQNLAKRVARCMFWTCAVAETNGGLCDWGLDISHQKFLCLLGPNAGDAHALLALGARPENICGVDLDPNHVAFAKASIPGIDARCGDVLATLRLGEKFDCVFLDFCGHLSRGMATTIWRVTERHLREGGLLGVGFMRGREKADFKSARSSVHADGPDCVGVTVTAGEPDDARIQTLQRLLSKKCAQFQRLWWADAIVEIRYQGTGVPMTYALLKKIRVQRGQDVHMGARLGRLSVEPTDLRPLALKIADEIGVDRAARLMCLSRKTLVAWKAHTTMGTYRATEAQP